MVHLKMELNVARERWNLSSIVIEKLIAHDLDLDQSSPRTYKKLMNLSQIPVEVLKFFYDHISNALTAKQIKTCKFTHQNAAVLLDCLEISNDPSNDKLFIDNSINMTQLFFKVMKSSSSRSSGTLIFIIYNDLLNTQSSLAILKMDPNKAIQIDRKNYKFVVQENILPGVKEKLHKCAFVKLMPALWDEEHHLRVLDKQQSTGEVSQFFLMAFLESQVIVDNKAMTALVSSTLIDFAIQENIIETQLEIIDFNAKIDRMLSRGRDIDLDYDLDSLFAAYIPGDADRVSKIDGYKKQLVEKRETSIFQFVADKKPTIATFTDPDSSIKIQFPLQDKDTKIFLDYETEEDGAITTIIKIKGVELKEKFN